MIGRIASAAVLTLAITGTAQATVDEEAAQSLAKKSNCFRCHAIDKKKDGPPYKEVAAKYRGKAEAPDKLFKHVTTNPVVKIDGKEEEHISLKTKDEQQIRNVVAWILSR